MEAKKLKYYQPTKPVRNAAIITMLLLLVVLFFSFTGIPVAVSRLQLALRANFAYRTGSFDDAEVLYSIALKNNVYAVETKYNLANAYYRQERYREAIEAYKKAVTSVDQELNILALNNLGNAYYKIGNLRLSADAYKKALFLNDGDQQIKENLLFILSRISAEDHQIASKNSEKSKTPEKNTKESKSQQSQGDGEKDNKVSDNNIADMLSLINRNEQSTNAKISKAKSKSPPVIVTGQDY